MRESKTMPRPFSLNKKYLAISDYFRINHNIIQKNKHNLKHLTKKKSLKNYNTTGQSEPNQKYLNVLTGRFVDYVPERDRLKLHQFFQCPIKRSNAQTESSEPSQFGELKKIRLKFMQKENGYQKHDWRLQVLAQSLSENLQKQLTRITEKDEKLLSSIGVKVVGTTKLKRIKNKNHEPNQKFKQIVRNTCTKLTHISRQFCRHTKYNPKFEVSKMLPVKAMQHKYSNSLFQLINMARRRSQNTIDIIMSFLQKQPNLIYQYDLYRKTALHYFIQMKNIDMVRLLVRMGALVFVHSRSQPPIKTAFKIKWRQGIEAILDQLASFS